MSNCQFELLLFFLWQAHPKKKHVLCQATQSSEGTFIVDSLKSWNFLKLNFFFSVYFVAIHLTNRYFSVWQSVHYFETRFLNIAIAKSDLIRTKNKNNYWFLCYIILCMITNVCPSTKDFRIVINFLKFSFWSHRKLDNKNKYLLKIIIIFFKKIKITQSLFHRMFLIQYIQNNSKHHQTWLK